MKYHLARIVAVIAIAGSASACDKIFAPTAPAVSAADYEAVSIQGSNSEPGGLLRVNLATGQTVVVYDNQATLTPVADTPAVPAGIYHIYAWSTVNPSNSNTTWNAERMDTVSGRIWRLMGDGNTTPFSWSEQTVQAKI